MYTMVMMAALTTGIDMPDRGGRRGGGCCGCYGGGYGGMGMGMGMGYGGCMGMGMGYGGCYGMGMGMGGGYGMGMRGYRMGWGGYGYGGYTLGSVAPMMGSYAYSGTPYTSGWGNSLGVGGGMLNQGTNQSFYFGANSANEATIVVHLPQGANLTIDGEQTQQQSGTRTFTSPPLESGKTYTYTLKAEIKRDGHTIRDTKTIDVQAGRRSEVTMKLENGNRDEEVRAPASRSSPRAALRR